MEYSIPVIEEAGKKYFLACRDDMRFLFRRLNASSLIALPERAMMDKFEVRRNEEIIIAGECYNLYGKHPVILIKYSEMSAYRREHNDSTPHEELYADDFMEGDMVFSDVNAHEVKARGFSSIVGFFDHVTEKMALLQNGLLQRNTQMNIAASQTSIRRVENNHDALGLRTFIVPAYF